MSRISTGGIQPQQQQASQAPQIQEIDIRPDGLERPPVDELQRQPDPNTEHLRNIAERVGQLTQQQPQGNEFVNRLAANPLVQQLLQAEQQGKKVRLVEEQTDPFAQLANPNGEEAEPDWVELGQNPQKMAVHVTKSVGREVSRQLGPMIKQALDSRFQIVDQLTTAVRNIGEWIQGQQSERTKSEFDQVRNLNPTEFDSLKPVMAEIMRQSPGLNIRDLYVLARARQGLPPTMDQTVQTERPTSQTTARPPFEASPHPYQAQSPTTSRVFSPRGSFDQTLENLLGKADFSIGR